MLRETVLRENPKKSVPMKTRVGVGREDPVHTSEVTGLSYRTPLHSVGTPSESVDSSPHPGGKLGGVVVRLT